MIYIFDESDVFFRSPGGAVGAPGKLKLRIKLRRGAATFARVAMYPDGGDSRITDMNFDHVTGQYDVYQCELNIESPGLFWYYFQIFSGGNEIITVPEHQGGAFQITACPKDVASPQWIQGGVIYHIFVDRFRLGGERRSEDGVPCALKPGAVFRSDWGGCPYFLPDEGGAIRNNDFFGGDLYGIIEKLPYLKELGVTCIYLSPVFDANSNHKYDISDFMKIDSAFGGGEALEQLCGKALEQGIRVILDGVFNFVGEDSVYFNKFGRHPIPGAYQGKHSPYYGWFNFRDNGKYDAWNGYDLLPTLNKMSESFKQFICGENGVISYWTKKGVSGWRLDFVDDMPDSFLDPLCAAIKRDNPDALIIGEVGEDASHKITHNVRRHYLTGGQLDSVTNHLLKDAIISCVKDGNVAFLAETMSKLCRNYPPHILHSLMNIIGTHDTMRALTVLSGVDLPGGKPAMSVFKLTDQQHKLARQRLMLAATLQFTLPGLPCIYYGDEAGMEGGIDPFNRRCYPWGYENQELIRWYSTLSSLRSKHNCFKNGAYELVEARDGLFAFTRGQGLELVLIAVNISDRDRTLEACGFNYDLLKNDYTDVLIVKAGEPGIFITKGDIAIR